MCYSWGVEGGGFINHLTLSATDGDLSLLVLSLGCSQVPRQPGAHRGAAPGVGGAAKALGLAAVIGLVGWEWRRHGRLDAFREEGCIE